MSEPSGLPGSPSGSAPSASRWLDCWTSRRPKNVINSANQTSLLAADIFNEAELWRPVLDPVMTRLSLKVRWWQLGRDDDISFVGYPDLAGKIREIKGPLERFGQEIHLGMGWRWLNESPTSKKPPLGISLLHGRSAAIQAGAVTAYAG